MCKDDEATTHTCIAANLSSSFLCFSASISWYLFSISLKSSCQRHFTISPVWIIQTISLDSSLCMSYHLLDLEKCKRKENQKQRKYIDPTYLTGNWTSSPLLLSSLVLLPNTMVFLYIYNRYGLMTFIYSVYTSKWSIICLVVKNLHLETIWSHIASKQYLATIKQSHLLTW